MEGKELSTGVRLEQRGEWTVLHIDYFADPPKRDPEWAIRMRARLGEQRYRREILRDWAVAAGEPYFLEFANDPEAYVYEPPFLLDAPIHVGMDFGLRHPAAAWLQYDEKNDRVFTLREWMPAQIDAYSFREIVLWLSGEKTIQQLAPYARPWADRLYRDASFPSVPFFPERSQAMNIRYWAGHEALMQRAEVTADTEERSTAEIWEAAGIQLGAYAVPVAARELAIRQLLNKRDDGYPGIFFSPHCRNLVDGFAGGITFAKGTKANPMPDRAARDGFYEHLLDGLGYAVVQLSSFRGPMRKASKRAEPILPKSVYTRPTGVIDEDAASIPVKETRRSVWSPFRKPY